jgi:serine/threonine protein kinase
VDLPQIIGGKYRPLSILGTGATGTIYSVEHTFTGELLALKVMKAHLGASADAIARFKREARAVSKIRSQHVVRIFDADVAPELGGVPYLVMDLLEGRDLEQESDNKPVSPEDVVEWFRQVALALDKAHRIGIVHRDLKPENLFLTRLDDGTPLVKILDFGIAKIAADSPGTTLSGQLFGTPLYMAPEQARGDPAQMGPATDLFALGQIAYRLLTGVAYRTAANLTEMLSEIIHERVVAPSARGHSFGADFDRWFLRACHADPASRFSSAHEQVEALAMALGLPAESEAVASPSSGRHEPISRESPIPQPDSNVITVSSLRAMSFEKGAEMGAKGAGMPTLLAVEDRDENPFARKNGWRLALVGALVVVGIPFIVMALYRERPPPAAIARQSSACPVESTLGSAAAEPSGAWTAVVVPQRVETLATTAAHPGEAEGGRQAPVRAGPPRVVIARRSAADDDPLSDQK